jgi:hypothetical protein
VWKVAIVCGIVDLQRSQHSFSLFSFTSHFACSGSPQNRVRRQTTHFYGWSPYFEIFSLVWRNWKHAIPIAWTPFRSYAYACIPRLRHHGEEIHKPTQPVGILYRFNVLNHFDLAIIAGIDTSKRTFVPRLPPPGLSAAVTWPPLLDTPPWQEVANIDTMEATTGGCHLWRRTGFNMARHAVIPVSYVEFSYTEW